MKNGAYPSGSAKVAIATFLALALLTAMPSWISASPRSDESLQADPLEQIHSAEVSEEARAAAISLIEDAVAEGIPADPLVAKFLEGVSKGVAEGRIIAAVRTVSARLQRALEVLQEAVHLGAIGPPSDIDVVRVAAGYSAGVPPRQVLMLANAAAEAALPIARVGAAVSTIEAFRGMGVYEESVADTLASALAAGHAENDFRRLIEDYRRHANANGDPATFFDTQPEQWEREGVSGTGILHDGAGRLEGGRLSDEGSGTGESMIPGTDRVGRNEDEDSDPYAGERPRPEDLIPGRPDGDEDDERQEPPDSPEGI